MSCKNGPSDTFKALFPNCQHSKLKEYLNMELNPGGSAHDKILLGASPWLLAQSALDFSRLEVPVHQHGYLYEVTATRLAQCGQPSDKSWMKMAGRGGSCQAGCGRVHGSYNQPIPAPRTWLGRTVLQYPTGLQSLASLPSIF